MLEGRSASGRRVVFLKRTLLALWSVWWTIVFATNVMDGAKLFGLVGEGSTFASGNYLALKETTARYGSTAWLNRVLFLGVIAWEGVAGLLFWRAWWKFRGGGSGRDAVLSAFTVGLTLWLAFLIADEICIAYRFEGAHLGLFIAQLATLMALETLPEGASSPGG
jgi:hypothetical protein